MTSPSPPSDDGTPEATPPDTVAADAPGLETNGFFRVLAIGSRAVTAVLAFLSMALFVWLVFVVCWQVFTRQVLHDSAPWTSEAATVSLVVFAMIAVAYVYSERGHIAVEMFIGKLPLAGQRITAVIIELIVMFFTVLVFIWGGIRVSENAWGQSLSILPFTVGQVYLVLPIAGVLILLYSLIHTVRVIAGIEAPLPEFDENAEAI